jgi:FKBP-type peptidyl-prolyl cis-trans isomerase
VGTEKRERQKAGRQARVEAALVAQKKDSTRKRVSLGAGILVFVVVAVGLTVFLVNRDSDSTASPTTSTPGASTTTTMAESAAGKPCVEFSDTLPAGAPEVPITPGPPPTELVIEDLVEGTGEVIPAGATVTMDYIGVSCSTGKIFDASYKRGQPLEIGLNQVIPGWTDGVPGMKVGGTRLLIIPPDQGYGARGSTTIAPDETLYFVITAEGFTPGATAG